MMTTKTEDENKVDLEKVEIVEEKIEQVAEEIEETPDEEKDEEWQAKLISSLDRLTQEVQDLKKAPGASAEIAAMQQQIKRLATALESFTIPPTTSEPTRSEETAEAAPSSPGTKTETSSETEVPDQKEKKPEAPARKNQRAWL